jgi:hypothetical protein
MKTSATRARDEAQGELFEPVAPSAPVAYTSFSFTTGAITRGNASHAAKLAGRLNAARVSEREHRELFDERKQLLLKKFAGDITPRELSRLEYVRWSLDRIEDAKHGYELDELEAQVTKFEQFVSEIRHLEHELQKSIPQPPKGKPVRR